MSQKPTISHSHNHNHTNNPSPAKTPKTPPPGRNSFPNAIIYAIQTHPATNPTSKT